MKAKTLTLAAALVSGAGALSLGVHAAPAAKAAGPGAVAHRFIDDFNRGDAAGAEATQVADVSIIDEVPPHAWKGPGAFTAWAGDLAKASKAAGDTDEKVMMGRPSRLVIEGDVAYAVFPVIYRYNEKGVATVEPAHMVYAFRKEGGAWKITAWTWAGGAPHPAAAKPAAKPGAAPAKKP
ncbi:MAG TPA: hypothetical protein VGS12_08425 [Caulobacteraceae bacterium]|nr:hypothetical protein [Caulobacteraceae bacterium]